MKIIEYKKADFLILRNQKIDISSLEKKYNLKLPPIFKSFIENFEEISGEVIINENEEIENLSYYKAYNLKGEDLFFQGFIEIEEIFEDFESSDIWVENGVIPISEHDHGGTIVLGINDDNQDKLFFDYNELEFLETDIYSFIKNLKFVTDYEGDFNSIYKKWNENFWRNK